MGEGEETGRSSEVGSSPPAHRVFLSYASADAAIAQQICEFLEGHGASCWMAPRDVKPGAQYADAIVAAINEARVLVLVLSGSAVASTHVGKEVERASSKRKPIIAFRVDAAALNRSLEYFLSESQWIDVPALGTPTALTKLAEAVAQRAAQGGAAHILAVDGDFPGRGKRKRVAVVAAVGIAVGIAAISGLYLLIHKAPRPTATAAIADKSIAVLPFVDMSEKKDQEYFADGMAEEILDLLAKIPGLTVIGRTSSFQFKGKNEDLRKIGAELGAAYVLEGSIRKVGDRLRVTAQLIRTRDGTHRWSETYDREMDDVLAMQDAIAAALVHALQITVGVDSLDVRSTRINPEAYELYLRGRLAEDRDDREGLNEAATLFQEALDRDGQFAAADAELARTVSQEAIDLFLPPATAFEQARHAALAALRLDPHSSLAHGVLGTINVSYDWDWAAGEREFKQELALAPGGVDALYNEASLSLTLGHWDDAFRQITSALAHDPLDSASFQVLSDIQTNLGRLPEAEHAIRRALEINPTSAWWHYFLGLILLARGERDAALLEMQKETADEAQLQGLAIAYYALGRTTESSAALNRLIEEHANEDAFGIASVYASRGDAGEAVQWLDRAYAQREPGLAYVKEDLMMKGLMSDPRYKAFLRKMNLAE